MNQKRCLIKKDILLQKGGLGREPTHDCTINSENCTQDMKRKQKENLFGYYTIPVVTLSIEDSQRHALYD